jgi:hypothetical protein
MPQIPAQSLSVPRFRLVGRDGPDRPSPVREREVRRNVAQENHAASALSPFDARLIFAQHVGVALEGGRAAILRPERRQALIAQAKRLGLRPFDANLVIAIVQDAAVDTKVDAQGMEASLAMVPKAQSHRKENVLGLVVISLVAGGFMLALLIRFITSP